MTLLEFMAENPWLTFFVLLVVLPVSCEALGLMLKYTINRPLRHMNISKHGWPPAHCDADGDFKDVDEIDDKSIT